jgi:hypothetical protein
MKIAARLTALVAIALCMPLGAADARIIKTLPHFLDQNGRHTLHPSLFERDGYQANLKTHPELVSGMRFDVQWKAHQLENGRLKLQVRGAKTPARQIETFESHLKGGGLWSHWTGVTVNGADFQRLGSIIAWRISLWDGEREIAEQKSFLW